MNHQVTHQSQSAHNQIDIYLNKLTLMSGASLELSDYREHVILIVNTASRCGLTSQYKQLENLYQKYRQHKFMLIGCPCDQFGGQELATNDEVLSFCQLKFNISFPLTQKLKVNGAQAHPLFVELKRRATGMFGTQSVKWNFTKFLIAPNLSKIKRYKPQRSPMSLDQDIQNFLHLES